MEYLFDDFSLFVLAHQKQSEDVCVLFNAFMKKLGTKTEVEFASEQFALFLMIGESVLQTPPDIQKVLYKSIKADPSKARPF